MKFKVGDKVVSGEFNQYPDWRGLIVDRHVYDNSYVHCTSSTGRQGAFTVDDLTLAKPPRDYVADHARRSLRKLGLTKQEAAAFVRNVQTLPRMKAYPEFTLSELSRRAASADLSMGFCWGGSPQGFDYWGDIYDRVEPVAG